MLEKIHPSSKEERQGKRKFPLAVAALLTIILAASCGRAEPTPPFLPTVSPFASPTQALETPPPTITPTQNVLPSPTRIEATVIPKSEKTIYSQIRQRLQILSRQRRDKQKADNPNGFQLQIDPELTSLDPTMLILGCGYDYAPPLTYKATVCANTLLVFGEKISRFSLTHDTGFLKSPGVLVRSDQLILGPDGSLPNLKNGWQNATGAPIDFVMVLKDNNAIKDLVKKSFGGRLRLNNPIPFTAHPVWIDGKNLSEEKFYPAGEAEYSDVEILQYATSTPKADKYPPELENHERLQTIAKAMLTESNNRRHNLASLPGLFTGSTDFLVGQIRSGNISADFDVSQVLVESFQAAAAETLAAFPGGKSPEIAPHDPMGESLYLLDPSISPNKVKGLKWATHQNEPGLPKHYPDYFFETPDWREICASRDNLTSTCGPNFNSPDLVRDYWPPVRAAFKAFAQRNSLYNYAK